MNQTDRTQERLLDAGRKLFAENGFEAASVRAITHAAAANLGAITYHFGSKALLYEAVLELLFGGLAERVTAVAARPDSAVARLGAIVDCYFDFFQEHPEAPRLMLHHLAGGGPPPRAAVRQVRRVMQAILGVVRDGQARGDLRAVEPLLAVFTLVSQTVWFAVARPMIATVSGAPAQHPQFADVMRHHISDVVSRTLAPEQGSR